MIQEEILALPPRMRQVFELRHLENLNNKEIASRMNTTESTAADQLTKANKILKSRLGPILVLASLLLR
jgi:RNA polymerase sigma-70 factor (ECF subfamily)